MIDTMWHNAISVLGDSDFWVWMFAVVVSTVLLARLLDALEGIHSELRQLRLATERRDHDRDLRRNSVGKTRTTALGTRVGPDGRAR